MSILLEYLAVGCAGERASSGTSTRNQTSSVSLQLLRCELDGQTDVTRVAATCWLDGWDNLMLTIEFYPCESPLVPINKSIELSARSLEEMLLQDDESGETIVRLNVQVHAHLQLNDLVLTYSQGDFTIRRPTKLVYEEEENVVSLHKKSFCMFNDITVRSFRFEKFAKYPSTDDLKLFQSRQFNTDVWQPDTIRTVGMEDVLETCDVLTKKLLKYIPNTSDLYRLYSDFHDNYKIDEDIKKISNFKDNDFCNAISRTHFFNKKIIITTLSSAWRLQKFRLHFSHVVIDEAGEATQPDAMIPLSLLKPNDYCQIIISGDHQLLGPDYIRSEFARKLIGQSILEKLMKREPYQKNPTTGLYDPRFITKLIRHYRSNSDIIGVPNELFYNNELIVQKDEIWQTRTETIAFYSVEGFENKTSNFKSSYNEHEINQVLHLVEKHIGKRLGDKIINGSDIGIVTSFTVQTAKIRKRLNNVGLREVAVGPVEAYQGQEKEIIIICTVKSKKIGFYWNSRRFNAAVTRARTSLLLVGNPHALQTDKYWCYFLELCQQKNTFYGRSMVISNQFGDVRQGLTIGSESKSKKSTELFDEWLTNWKIDERGHDESAIADFYNHCKRQSNL